MKTFWSHPSATIAPFQCHCREFSKYLVISDWLKQCQKCAILAVRSLTSELRHVTLHFLTPFARRDVIYTSLMRHRKWQTYNISVP